MLNRVVNSTKEGIEYEGDQRYAEIIIRDVGFKEHSKGVTTPGVNDEVGEDEGEVSETLCRAIAARANYLAQNRPDIQFAAKEVSRLMSKPQAGDSKRARRLGGYLQDSFRIAFSYKFQMRPDTVVVWSDRILLDAGGSVGAHLVE